jgi:cell shape-determining protein MreC
VTLLFILPMVVAFPAHIAFLPIYKIQTWVGQSLGNIPALLTERSKLADEIQELKLAQSSLGDDQLTIQFLTSENEELHSLLGDGNSPRIVAGVIGRPNKTPYDVLVLDKGSRDGIFEGSPVYIGNNAVVGIVSRVFPDSSVVTLVTTPGFQVSVYILGPNIYTNAEGIGGGQLRVGVPQGIQLNVGDLVILPGIDAGIYGKISVIDSIPTQPEQYGYVSPEIPLTSIRLVSVGKAPLEAVTFEEAQAIVSDIRNSVFLVPIPDHILVTTDATSSATSSNDVVIPTATSSSTSSGIQVEP